MRPTHVAFVLLLYSCALTVTAALAAPGAEFATDKAGIVGSYRVMVPAEDFETTKRKDEADKPRAMERQRTLLESRYDLANRPSPVQMSGGRKAVQQGVRVKLQDSMTWERLAALTPDQVRERNLLPRGFLPLLHVKHETGGMVFPRDQIEQIDRLERRSLERFDVEFDLPVRLTPEFPPPVFLTTRPELGDISKGQLLTIKNFFALTNGILTPVQIEGLRLLLTPFPQEEFQPDR
jgi:hypothetical protein